MATENLCDHFMRDKNFACKRNLTSKFFQEVVLIKKRDIKTLTKLIPDGSADNCQYSVSELVLNSGLSGVKISAGQSSSVIKGYAAKSKDDKGIPQYTHKVDIIQGGVAESDMCNLDALDHELFVAVLQAVDGTIIVYGADNGLTTADYEYDIVANNGLVTITLQSDEKSPERYLPLVYLHTDKESSVSDFNSKFAAP